MTLDELQRLRAAAGLADLLVGGVGIADPQVLRDRAVEQQRLLEHDADLATQAGEGDVADIGAVDGDVAGLRIVDAMQDRQRRRFAGTGAADQRYGVAGLGGERQILDCGLAAVITEGDVLERHIAADMIECDRALAFDDAGGGVEYREEFRQPWRIHEDAVDEAGHLFEPLDQHAGEAHEHHDLADRRLPPREQPQAEQ